MTFFARRFFFHGTFSLLLLKAIYQITYIIFTLLVVKQLSVDSYGAYSYILALIVYFSSIPLLGLPTYLQKCLAKDGAFNKKYFLFPLFATFLGVVFVSQLMDANTLFEKIAVVIIILFNSLMIITVSITDGLGRYTFQYYFLLINSLWMLYCLLKVFVFHQIIHLDTILSCWLINILLSSFLIIPLLFKLLHRRIQAPEIDPSSSFIFTDLLLFSAVTIPDAFARFYDKFLAHKYLGDQFLGQYSFNLMLVLTIYALFIRPINSILFTQLAKHHYSPIQSYRTVKVYYQFGFIVYWGFFFCYWLGNNYFLRLGGMTKYQDSMDLFFFCFINGLLYFIALPFMILITLSDNRYKKIVYCIASLLVFNIPLICLILSNSKVSFCIGFTLAYLLNAALSVYLEYMMVNEFIRMVYLEMRQSFNKIRDRWYGAEGSRLNK